MSEEIKVVGKGEGDDTILKLVSAVDKLTQSLERLASGNTALEKMQRQMKSMQASMTTGFAEMAGAAAAGEEKIRKVRQTSAEKLLQDQLKAEAKQHAQANKFHYKQIEAQDTLLMRQRESYSKFWQGVLAEQIKAEAKQAAAQQRRDLEMHNQTTKATNSYVSLWEKMLTQRQQITERRDMEMHQARQKERASYEKFWDDQLKTQEAKQAKQLALARQQQVDLHRIQAAEAERARNLNVNYLTATPASQLRTAQKAQVYTQQGGNAAAKFGSAAAGADIAALQRQLEQIPGAANRSRDSLFSHNEMMREGHSLARGLAGSLGGLWLTYGSLVPLAAGAAIAASLKGIVTVGKEVEHQLNFVLALTGTSVSLDKFLTITDSSLSSVTEAANAMRALAQNGLNATQSLQVLPSILQLATVGEMQVGQAALAATGAVAAFGLEFTEAGRVADIFAKTAANSNTSVLAITESMKQASTVASLFHVTIEETAAMLGLLAKINITGGAAGTSFTNMLTGLYEPTNQGKRALKELGIETQTATGALKPYTQLLGEMKTALSGYTDYARVDFLGDIFTVRGVKSAELALQNVDEFTKKAQEAATASGFMASTMRILEDDTQGAFKRLSVAVENTFVRAFAEAAPYVQQIGLHLAEAFKPDGDVQSGLSNLSTNVARATGFMIDHAGAIALAIVGYKALTSGVMLNVVGLVTTAATATATSTAATVAATAAQGAHATAMAAGTATQATYNTMVQATTASTVAATAASRAWMAVVLPALGALAIAVAAAAAVWLVFRDNTNEADRANTKISNSLATVSDQLDKEIERLEKANRLWDEKNGKYKGEDSLPPQGQDMARASYYGLRARVKQDGYDENGFRSKVTIGGTIIKEAHDLADELAKAKSNMEGYASAAEKSQRAFGMKEIEKVRNATAGLNTQLEKFRKEGEAKNSAGEFFIKDDKLRAVFGEAKKLQDQLLDPSKRLKGVTEELDRIEKIGVDLKQLNDKANEMRVGRAEKPDKKGENDGFRAMLQAQQNAAQEAADIAKYIQAEYDSLYKTGELSATDYFTKTRDLTIKTAQDRLAAFQEEERISAMRENRSADVIKFQGKQAQMQREIDDAERARTRGLNEYIYAEEKRRTTFEVDELRRRGELTAAYMKEHGPQVQKLDLDVKASQAALIGARAGGDPKEIALAERVALAAQTARTAWDGALKSVMHTESFQKAEGSFDTLLAKITTGMTELQEKNSEGSGLAAIFRNAMAAEELYSSSLDDLIRKQKTLATIADQPGATDDQKKSSLDALKKIEDLGSRMRGIWNAVGGDIEKSLTKAFGNSGKAAGGLLRTFMDLSSRRKKMDDDLAKNSEGADPQKMAQLQAKYAQDASSAQISAYGDMAGAAKGFFDENTRGYAALEATEKAFRLFELAMAAESMVKKLFFKSTETTASLGMTAAKVTGEAAATGASVGLAATESSAWGITAVVKALASLPFPANLAAGAATLAAVVAIGGKLMGSLGGAGSVSVSEQRQAKQGTGSVLGDRDAKSESVSRALEMLEKNSFQDLAISNNMLTSLRNIEAGIGSFATLLVRTIGVDGEFGSSLVQESKAGKIGNSITGFLDPVLGGMPGKWMNSLMNGIFGGKQTLQDSGFMMDKIDFSGVFKGWVSALQYADVKKDGGLFSVDKNKTNLEGLGLEGNRQVAGILVSLYDTVFEAGKMLGLGTDAFSAKLNSFVIDIGKVSLKGLTGDEIKKELAAVFSKVGDDLAQFAIADLSRFQQVGEGYLETLVRVANNYQTIDVVMQSLGMAFNSVGLGSLDARERLIELAGGLDEFKSGAEQFLNDFYTDKERAAALKTRITPTLQQYGLSTDGPDAMKLFRDFVVALDTTTASGAAAYTSLIAISPAFKAIIDASDTVVKSLQDIKDEAKELQDQLDEVQMTPDQLLNKERDKLDPSNRGLFDQIQAAKQGREALEATLSLEVRALNLSGQKTRALALERSNELAIVDKSLLAITKYAHALDDLETARSDLQSAYDREKTKIEEVRDKFKELGKSLREFLTDLDSGDLSNKSPQDKYLAAKTEFEKTYQLAMSGDADAMARLQAVSQTFLEQSKEYNATGTAYTTDFAAVKDAISKSAGYADAQVTIAEQQLKEMEKLVSGILDLNANMLSFADALKGYNTALGAANQAGGALGGTASSSIEALYRSVFGRASDTDGKAYWMDAYKKGTSLSEIQEWMMKSDEYKNLPRRAGGGQSNGPTLVGETGPEIVNFERPGMVYTANQTVSTLSKGGDDVQLAKEIKPVLDQVLIELKAANTQRGAVSAKTTEKLEELASQVESNTRVIERNNT